MQTLTFKFAGKTSSVCVKQAVHSHTPCFVLHQATQHYVSPLKLFPSLSLTLPFSLSHTFPHTHNLNLSLFLSHKPPTNSHTHTVSNSLTHTQTVNSCWLTLRY